MPYFSETDNRVVEGLKYNPILNPAFDFIKFCLIWEDEKPGNISSDGYDQLCDLWLARYYLYHRKSPKDKLSSDYIHYEEVWRKAKESNLQWPGFKNDRLYLSPRDKSFLHEQVKTYDE